MKVLGTIVQHYLWVVVILALFMIGGSIYFTYQRLGLTFVLSGAMLILAMENSDMIHAVEMKHIESNPVKPFLVHFSSQQNIALFIWYYHICVYGFLVLFSVINILTLTASIQVSQIINILIIAFFLAAAITIFFRRIHVGSKYEH